MTYRCDRMTRLTPCVSTFVGFASVGVIAWIVASAGCRRDDLQCVEHPENGYAFPASEDIANLRVVGVGQPAIRDFDAPKDHYPALFESLSPSQAFEGVLPCYQILATLEIQTEDGETTRVQAYDLVGEAVGVFGVGVPPWSHSYRGRLAPFVEAVKAAAEAAKPHSSEDSI